MRRSAIAVTAALALTAALAATAQAVHWPFFGGDNGRSGYQPVGEGKTPLRFLYAKTEESDRFIKSSVLTTTGSPATQRVIYGTANGNIHLQILATGAPVGPEAGVAIDDLPGDDTDTFGPRASDPNPASVSFVDTSGATGLGQVFAVHNDDNRPVAGGGTADISLAQVDEATGDLVRDVGLPDTNGFRIVSSAVATGPAVDDPATEADETGNRAIFFVADNGDMERLFRVAITNNASSRDAQVGAVTRTDDIDANTVASPTIVFLNTPGGDPVAHVALATRAGASVRTFRAGNLATAGPASADLGGVAQTPTVPITPSGMTPGAGTPGVTKAPFLYVAFRAGDTTIVRKLTQEGNAAALTQATGQSQALAGAPAPALATDQEVETAGPGEGKVIVTTGSNLYLLNVGDLSLGGTFSPTPRAPGTTGFGQTTAASSGDFVYVTTDEGEQLVLRVGDAQPVAAAEFTENAANGGDRLDNSGMGQPSISRGFIQYASQKGLFVYVNRCGNTVAGATDNPDRLAGGLAGDAISGAGGEDVLDGGIGDDCIAGLAGNDIIAGGTGIDELDGGDGVDVLSGGPDNDSLLGGAERDYMTGDAGDDTIDGQTGSNVIDGGIGNDTITGGERSDSLNGGSDEDTIRGGEGGDGITGASGNDRLFGDGGDDRIEGGLGKDEISGGAGGDNIVATDGIRDVVTCGSGADVVRADAGDSVSRDCERIVLSNRRRAGSSASAAQGPGASAAQAQAPAGSGARVSGDGTPGQELRGGEGGDTIDSVLADARLFGAGGDDVLSGGSGADRAEGGDGTDVLSGGPGNDTLVGDLLRDFLSGGPGTDRLEGGAGSNILNGSQGNDSLVGGELVDSLNGGSDEDRIFGGAGNDGITGASGNDRLFGQDGDDRIEGGLGKDVISGGNGGDNIVATDGIRDRIRCGAGADVVRADAGDSVARDCERVITR